LRSVIIINSALLALSTLVIAQTGKDLPKLMPSDREIVLAMSAGPAHVAARATIYVLEATGYVKAREGTNGFTCLVVRDTPSDIAPVCHDPEGSRTVVPRLLAEARLRADGKSSDEIRREINEGLRTGAFQLPQRVGIAYMLSTENAGLIDGRLIHPPPHVMFYAPFLKMDDIGARESDIFHPDLPVVISQGEFNAYVVIHVPEADRPIPSPTRDLDGLAASSNHLPAALSRDREIALALSAAPPHIARDASIYVIDAGGVVRAKEGTNSFACFVERDYNPRALYPVCYDPEGVRSLLPVAIRKTELLRQHKSRVEVEADIAEGFRSGRFRPPARISVAYMLSKEGRFSTPGGRIIGSTPHVRFYAPYVQSGDVGTLAEVETIGRLPTVVHGGSPDAYIVVNLSSDIGDGAAVAPK
jgi:hypothetical protein